MNIQLFHHPDFGALTTFKDNDGKEYYKAHDVCIALRLTNPSQQIKRHIKLNGFLNLMMVTVIQVKLCIYLKRVLML